MATTPKVSVIMAVYNGRPFLNSAIESVVNQTFGNFEFIIVNDGSTDGSTRVLEEWTSRDSRIRLVHQENKGHASSLNRGLQMARGSYIARMDADDISMPERFEKQVAFLDAHENMGVLGTNAEHIDEDDNRILVSDLPTDPRPISWSMLFTCPLYHPSIMMRKHLVQQVGQYDTTISAAEDYDLWSRLTLITDIANLPDVCIKYRWWDGNLSNNDRTQFADCAASGARLHSEYLAHENHSGEDVVRFFLDGRNESYAPRELNSYFCHTLNMYRAFVSQEQCSKEDLLHIRHDLFRKLDKLVSASRKTSRINSLFLRVWVLCLFPDRIPATLRRFLRAKLPAKIRKLVTFTR